MKAIIEERVRAGLYKIGPWYVEKRGAYWGVFTHPSQPPRFAAKTLAEARTWVARLIDREGAA